MAPWVSVMRMVGGPAAGVVVAVGPGPLSPADVVDVARHGVGVELTGEALAEIAKSREVVENLAVADVPYYGVSTGFGALATRHIPPDLRAQLQRSLIRSHAAGSGPEVEREVVRALMLLRLSTLATGRTGVRTKTATGLRGDARRRHHAGRARVRQPGLLGRPRAARPLRARADGRGSGARRQTAHWSRRRPRCGPPASSRSSWPRRRASP